MKPSFPFLKWGTLALYCNPWSKAPLMWVKVFSDAENQVGYGLLHLRTSAQIFQRSPATCVLSLTAVIQHDNPSSANHRNLTKGGGAVPQNRLTQICLARLWSM